MTSLMETELNKENFESAIAVGMKMQEMLKMFRVDGKEMDKWCLDNYGNPSFTTVYEIIKQNVICEYLDCVKKLGLRGNTSALNIIDNVLRGALSEQTVKIVFDNNVEPESEEDKLNDRESDGPDCK